MGGAFVAVADDATATWWNPAGLATGATVDLVLGDGRLDTLSNPEGTLPAARWSAKVFAFTTPAIGVSYYRLRFTEIGASGSTGTVAANRQDSGTFVPLRTLSVSQVGVSLVQFLVPGLHVGTTVKYLRGGATVVPGDGRAPGDRLAEGADLAVTTAGTFDLDIGIMAAVGALRAGVTVKNVRQPEFAIVPTEGHSPEPIVRLDRRARAGLAIDVSAAGGPPLIVAIDTDLRRVETPFGDRRNLAVGAEQWLAGRRVGVRGGLRASMIGQRRAAAAAGASFAARKGLYLEGQVTRGGDAADRGWTVGARVTF